MTLLDDVTVVAQEIILRMDNHYSRGILLKLQDRLSDNDRRRLHFFLGDDVPRRIRDDPSLTGTLSLLESLFDQDKINERDMTFLINAFHQIRCIDAVKLLREHTIRMEFNGAHPPTQSLASIMPQTLDQLLDDQEEDTYATTPLLNDENSSDETKVLLDSDNTDLNPMAVITNNATGPFSRLRQTPFVKSSSFKYKYLLFAILLLIISVGILAVLCVKKSISINQLQKKLKLKDEFIFEKEAKSKQRIQRLNNQFKDIENEKRYSLIKAGQKFGGPGGVYFDDSLTNNFTRSHYLTRIVTQRDNVNLDWIQFLYSSSVDDQSLLKGQVHGILTKSEHTEFILDKDEKISKVVGKLVNVTLTSDGVWLSHKILLKGIQFFTTKGRASQPWDRVIGETFTEEFNGYTVGYVTGYAGTFVDSLQFFWYRI